jgi:hypothetical protein
VPSTGNEEDGWLLGCHHGQWYGQLEDGCETLGEEYRRDAEYTLIQDV